MSDIRKWFMKQHDKGNAAATKPAKPTAVERDSLDKPVSVKHAEENSGRRKTSKYFPTPAPATAKEASFKKSLKEEDATGKTPAKRKNQKSNEALLDSIKHSPAKKHHKTDEDDNDFVLPNERKKSADVKPPKKLKRSSGIGITKDSHDVDESDGDKPVDKDVQSPLKASGRGRGGRALGTAAGGRGRGGGRGGFMNFGVRTDPPHKGEKEVPEGAPDCLAGLTFVISGTLDSLEREEAEDLIKRHGVRVTGSVSMKMVDFRLFSRWQRG